MEKLAYTVEESCLRLSLGKSKFYEEVKRGRIRTVKAGGKTLVTHQEQLDYVALLVREACERTAA